LHSHQTFICTIRIIHMVEEKSILALLFDIGGVCVRLQLLIGLNRDLMEPLGDIAIPCYPRL
jgi:hypothetical protein